MNKKDRIVPKKNYLLLLFMIVFVVIITFAIFDINEKYQLRKLETSYLSGYINEVNINDLSSIMTEPSSDLFILVTKTGNENVYNFESDLKKIIKNQDLRDNFIFINSDKVSIKELNNLLKSDISVVPAIIYFKNGVFVKSIDSAESILNSGDFSKLLDEYEVN